MDLSREHAVLLEVRGDRLCVFYRVIRARSGVFFGALSSAPIAMPVANLEKKQSNERAVAWRYSRRPARAI